MKAVTFEYAKKNFDKVFNMPVVQNDGLIIVKEDKNFVLIDKEFLDSVMETIEIAKDKELVSSLKESRAEIEKGESHTFEEVFGEEI